MVGKTEQNLGRGNHEHTNGKKSESSLPDVSLLLKGARETFPVVGVSRLRLSSIPYDGVLQGIGDYFGFALPKAPALVLLTDEHRRRFAELSKEGHPYPVPEKGDKRIVYFYQDGAPLFLAPPESATREQVAKVLTRAYIHNRNPSAITKPDQLWEPVTNDFKRKGFSFPPEEITTVLCEEALVTGLETWIGATTMLPEGEAHRKISDSIFGQKGERIFSVQQEYLRKKLKQMREARELLVVAETTSMSEKEGTNIKDVYLTAQTLKDSAAETLGVFYVDGVMELVSWREIARGTQMEGLITSMLNHPPTRLQDFRNPIAFIERQIRSDNLVRSVDPPDPKRRKFHVQTSRLLNDTLQVNITTYENLANIVGREPTSPPEEITEPPYPFRNVAFTPHWAEWQTVHAPEQGSNRQLADVPFYYHGPLASRRLSALVTPDVIKEYAHIMGDEYPSGIAERVTETLFGPFNQMNADPSLQDVGNEPEGFASWNQAGFRFLRHSSQQVGRTFYHHTGISLHEVGKNLVSAAGGKFTEEGKLIFEGRSGTTSSQNELLRLWYDNPTDPTRLERQERAAAAKPYENIVNLPVGITLESILQAVTTDAVTGPDGILSHELDQRFLQSMGDFIIQGHFDNHKLQSLRVLTEEVTPDSPTEAK